MLRDNLRDNGFLPVDTDGEVYTDFASGICHPRRHCAFAGCMANKHSTGGTFFKTNFQKKLVETHLEVSGARLNFATNLHQV